jgi:hypothetical protein
VVLLVAASLSGCGELPLVKAVHEQCASTPEPQRKACEDAAYAHFYAIERSRLALERSGA